MNSQLDKTNENQDQVFQEADTFRPVFFDQATKRNSPSALSDSSKRARLDASVIAPKDSAPDPLVTPSAPNAADSGLESQPNQAALLKHHPHILLHHPLLDSHPGSPTSDSDATATQQKQPQASGFPGKIAGLHRSGMKKSVPLMPPVMAQGPAGHSTKAPKLFRRFRSRSLPIINYTSRAHLLQHHMIPMRSTNQPPTGSSPFHAALSNRSAFQPTRPAYHHTNHHHQQHRHIPATPSLPPINLQSLKEIDLHEILKNPQLRHDILFDPQLQFRPNLDGERGRRKKSIMEKYWAEIESECKQFFTSVSGAQTAVPKVARLPALFSTLRDILLSLLPVKDRDPVNEIMDIDLLVQQLSHGSFDFVAMAMWLGEVFKSHCAPMRDQWVSDMISKFQQAYTENSHTKLVQGLRTVFSILEAMKLDVANHQIRILRPVLIETAVDFEKDYFSQLINHCKIDISDSLKWFYRNHHKKSVVAQQFPLLKNDKEKLKLVVTSSIIDLLSCRNMATEFPSTMAFDHTRLVLLRADVRQLVCVQLCIVLFKQLLMNYGPAAPYRQVCSKPEYLTKVQEEILAIVTDDNGNVKWTRNVLAIALQIVKKVATNPTTGKQVVANLPTPLITFSNNWLIKQIQPSSDVYGLMEEKIFKDLLTEIVANTSFESAITTVTHEPKTSTAINTRRADSEMESIATRISTLVKFHWSVFGDYYTDFLKANKDQK